MRIVSAISFCFICAASFAQVPDTLVDGKHYVTLTPVVLGKKLDAARFIQIVKNDSSFYKAFRTLHIVGFTAINDIRMNDAAGKSIASLRSTTKQVRENNCRTMQILSQTASGNMYNEDSSFNYYTANMYANLFFTKGRICNEDNTVSGIEFSTAGKSGMEKHKEQLKMLFFNPGRRIKGLPLMSNKTAIYDEELAEHYDMNIDWETKNGISCYVFKQKVKQGHESDIVVDEMNTWFSDSSFKVMARNYSLSYNTGLYDFKVSMEVEMTTLNDVTVPALIRYNGNWKVPFKKRERGVFTATLSNFN